MYFTLYYLFSNLYYYTLVMFKHNAKQTIEQKINSVISYSFSSLITLSNKKQKEKKKL